MRQWWISLGSRVLLLMVLGMLAAERDRQPLGERPDLSAPTFVTRLCQEAWASWISLPQRRRCSWNPARRHRLSKKARRRLSRRLGLGPGRRSQRSAVRTTSVEASVTATPPVVQSDATPGPVSATASPTVSATERAPARQRRRPAKIPTDHVFCPVPGCRGHSKPGGDPNHRIVGAGTYTTRSGKRQMYQCQWCKTRFSETQGTVFFGLKTPQETVYRALACLAEGLGIRATARVFDVKPEDVLRWLRRAGQHCEQVSAYLMRHLHVEQVQLDELWTFVRQKEKTLSAWEALHSEWGDTWIWTAVDPVNKLVLAFLVGDHTETEAVGIVSRVKAALVEGCLPLFTSDQLPHYIQAFLRVLGRVVQPARNGTRGRFPNPRLEAPDDLQYGTVHKERQGGRVISVTTQVVFGRADALLARLKALGMRRINTSFVERVNLTLRHLVSRLKRRGLNYSKKREYLVWHLQLAIGYYHLVRPHRGLRVRLAEPVPTRGTPKKWTPRTPAMAASLTDHLWTLEELLMFHAPPVAA